MGQTDATMKNAQKPRDWRSVRRTCHVVAGFFGGPRPPLRANPRLRGFSRFDGLTGEAEERGRDSLGLRKVVVRGIPPGLLPSERIAAAKGEGIGRRDGDPQLVARSGAEVGPILREAGTQAQVVHRLAGEHGDPQVVRIHVEAPRPLRRGRPAIPGCRRQLAERLAGLERGPGVAALDVALGVGDVLGRFEVVVVRTRDPGASRAPSAARARRWRSARGRCGRIPGRTPLRRRTLRRRDCCGSSQRRRQGQRTWSRKPSGTRPAPCRRRWRCGTGPGRRGMPARRTTRNPAAVDPAYNPGAEPRPVPESHERVRQPPSLRCPRSGSQRRGRRWRVPARRGSRPRRRAAPRVPRRRRPARSMRWPSGTDARAPRPHRQCRAPGAATPRRRPRRAESSNQDERQAPPRFRRAPRSGRPWSTRPPAPPPGP